MRHVTSVILVLVGLIHLLPLSAVLGAERVEKLYGVTVGGPDLEILLRHRAVLFGLLGAFLIFAAFSRRYQAAAFIGGLVSVISFLGLALSVGGYNTELQRVVLADWVALALLLFGIGLRLLLERHP